MESYYVPPTQHHFPPTLRSRIKTHSIMQKSSPSFKKSFFVPRGFPAHLGKVHTVFFLFVLYTILYIRVFRGYVFKCTGTSVGNAVGKVTPFTNLSSLADGLRPLPETMQAADTHNPASTQDDHNSPPTKTSSTEGETPDREESPVTSKISHPSELSHESALDMSTEQKNSKALTFSSTGGSDSLEGKSSTDGEGGGDHVSRKKDDTADESTNVHGSPSKEDSKEDDSPASESKSATSSGTNQKPGKKTETSQDDNDVSEKEVDDELETHNWNFTAIKDVNTAEHVFAYNSSDHAVVYKPLCFNLGNGTSFTIDGDTECSSMMKSSYWVHSHCEPRRWIVQSSLHMYVEKWNRPRQWLQDNEKHIRWVDGLSVLMMLDRACGNIAHLSGRALMLHHLLQNLEVYVEKPLQVSNILIVPNMTVMPWLNGEKGDNGWHTSILKSIVAPGQPVISTLENFLEHEAQNNGPKRIVEIIPNMRADTGESNEKFLCFKRAVVPGFLKGRCFLNDVEYPSSEASFESKLKDVPHVPRDSVRLRKMVTAVLGDVAKGVKRSKEIHLLDREDRRSFEYGGRKKLFAMMERVARENGYKFVVTSFSQLSFADQVLAMKRASIVVGIHGANLVNAMFMDPLSVLIEVFPYRFSHSMYQNGGNAGLKYMSHTVTSGTEYDGVEDSESATECIRKRKECKVFYRDAVLHLNNKDFTSMEELLKRGIDWIEEVENDN